MKKVTIYTAMSSRPDFIPVQYETFKKFIKDDYEYIVLNNAISSKPQSDAISRTCKELGIKCIKVDKKSKFQKIGGQKAISWMGSYKNATVSLPYVLRWAWQEICDYNKDKLFVIIDSDMFLCRPISFNEELGEKDASFILQYRGVSESREEALVTYPWNVTCIFNPEKTKNISEMNWDCGVLKNNYINGYAVDTGGYVHFWMKKNKIDIRNISEYAIHNFKNKEGGLIWIDAVINGNFHYSFDYDPRTKATYNFQVYERGWQESKAKRILPHFPEGFETILLKKTIKYFEKFVLDKQTYPDPTFLGFLEFENFNEDNEPFAIHNKAGGGYMGFDKQYGEQKLAFIEKTLQLDSPALKEFRTRLKIEDIRDPLAFIKEYKRTIRVTIRKIKIFLTKIIGN